MLKTLPRAEKAERLQRVVSERADTNLILEGPAEGVKREVLPRRPNGVEGQVGPLQHQPPELEVIDLDRRGIAALVCLRTVQIGLVVPLKDAQGHDSRARVLRNVELWTRGYAVVYCILYSEAVACGILEAHNGPVVCDSKQYLARAVVCVCAHRLESDKTGAKPTQIFSSALRSSCRRNS